MNNLLHLILTIGIILFFSSISICQKNESIEGNYEIDDINIKFVNSKTFEESKIVSLLASKSGDIFDMTTFLQDVERIKKFYFDNGFFDTEVDTGLQILKEDKEINETFIVKENARYVYLNIKYEGLDSVASNLISMILNQKESLTKRGRFFSKDSVNLE